MKDIASCTRRERKKLQCRYTILRAARECFRKNGYDETTIAEIAEAADVSYASFFNYFPTKESLIPEMSKEEYEDLQELVKMQEERGATPMYIARLLLIQIAEDMYLNKNLLVKMDAMRINNQSGENAAFVSYGGMKDFLVKYLQLAMDKGTIRSDIGADHQAIILLGIARACLLYGVDAAGCNRIIDEYFQKHLGVSAG